MNNSVRYCLLNVGEIIQDGDEEYAPDPEWEPDYKWKSVSVEAMGEAVQDVDFPIRRLVRRLVI